jgi:DNA modification methylase
VKTATQQSWPADQVERWPVDKLVPYARNSRTHSDTQVAQIAASIKEWGWTTPVLVSEDGTLIAGHGRVMAARKLGLQEVPVMIARGWTEAQRRAYVVADNQLALNAGWDMDLLSIEMLDLKAEGFDLSLIGFDDKMLDALLADKTEDGLTDPDDVPEPSADPVSKLGDVWVMDRHRLICGSSTEADTVGKLLGDVKPHLMVTDPPYGVEYEAGWRNEALGGKVGGRATGTVKNDDNADWREAWALFPGDVAYIWHADKHSPAVAESLLSVGLHIRTQIIWAKSQFVIGRGDYHSQHEPCWYAVRKGKPGQYDGGRKQSTLWQIDKPKKSETGHSTQKPVECMKRPIENNSSAGQAVYEPFSGSGTTIIAGEMTGRHVYAVELNPAYVDVAVKRWQEFTGKTATLEGDGRTFSEISEANAK